MADQLHIDQHISQKFNRELEEIRSKVLRMGGLVENQCNNALQALTAGDADLAEVVANSDHLVNDLEVEINAECMDILARRQPAASDLRMILAVIRVISDLERIGDHAVNICEEVVFLVKGSDVRHLSLEEIQARFPDNA